MRFCPTTYAISTLLQRFICIHLLIAHLTLVRAFSLSVRHSNFTAFAAQSGLVTPPVQRYRYFTAGSTPSVVSSLLQHVKERQFFLNFTAQTKVHKEKTKFQAGNAKDSFLFMKNTVFKMG